MNSNRMTHGQRYQAAQDWHEAQIIIAGSIFAFAGLVAFVELLFGI